MITMNAEQTIYTAVEAMLGIVETGKSILTTIEVTVSRPLSTRHQIARIHFLFQHVGSHILVFWARPGQYLADIDGLNIKTWHRSADHDSVQVITHDGIGAPLWTVAKELMEKSNLGLDINLGKFEIEASWLLGKPRVVDGFKLKKISKDQYDFRYEMVRT